MKGLLGTGTRDFLAVRITSLIIFIYVSFLLVFIFLHSPIDYIVWKNLFNLIWMKLATSIVMLSFVLHTWIGTSAISGDYLTSSLLGSLSKPIKILYSSLTAGIIVASLYWSLTIIW